MPAKCDDCQQGRAEYVWHVGPNQFAHVCLTCHETRSDRWRAEKLQREMLEWLKAEMPLLYQAAYGANEPNQPNVPN